MPSQPISAARRRRPDHWPEDITYLFDQSYSSAVTPEQRTALGRTTAESAGYVRIPAHLIQSPSPLVRIQIITAAEHPARGQRGLFAAQALAPDQFICLYLGLVHTNRAGDTDDDSDYDLSLDRALGLSVDAARAGNESRCANDYRGVAGADGRPNAEFRDCMIQVASDKRAAGSKWERRVAIFVLSAGKAGKRKAGIAAGQEILLSYGKGFWEARKQAAAAAAAAAAGGTAVQES